MEIQDNKGVRNEENKQRHKRHHIRHKNHHGRHHNYHSPVQEVISGENKAIYIDK